MTAILPRMIDIVSSDDRERIEAFLRSEAAVHVYALADLDDFFWPQTRWWLAVDGGRDVAVCLLLEGLSILVLYAVAPTGHEPTAALLEAVRPTLPERFFVNLGLDLTGPFERDHRFEREGEYQKMWLPDLSRVPKATHPGLVELGPADRRELEAFYRDAYTPEERGSRFFEPYMLEAGPWFGIRENGALRSAGGVHVCSRRYRVGALGNVATIPAARRRGLGREVSAAICRSLSTEVDLIGLNVATENDAAVRCYESLGFRPVARYLEGIFERRA